MLLDAIYQSNQIAKDQTSKSASQLFVRGSNSRDRTLLCQQPESSFLGSLLSVDRVAASSAQGFENDPDFFLGRKSFFEDFRPALFMPPAQ
jgi:hypothetical protein